MKKQLALVLALVVGVLWYANSGEPVDAFVPERTAPAESPQGPAEFPTPLEVPPPVEREAVTLPLAFADSEAPVVTVSANCVDIEGTPMKGIELVAMSIAGEPSAFSNAMGDVELVLMVSDVLQLAGQSAAFVLRSRATVTAVKHSPLRPTEDTFLGQFTLEAGGVVQGKVFDWTGAPAVGALVYCAAPVVDRQSEDFLRRRVVGLWRQQSPVVAADENGHYEIEGVTPSTLAVSAYLPGSLRSTSEPVSIRAGQVATVLDLVLEQAPPESLIQGTVQTREGQPRAGTNVTLESPDGEQFRGRTTTDAAGRFTAAVEPGSISTIRAGRPGDGLIYAFGVEAGTMDLVIRPKDNGSLLVIAKSTDGKALPGFGADLRLEDGRMSPGGFGVSEDGQAIQLEVPQHTFYVSITSNSCGTAQSGPYDPQNPPERVEAIMTPLPGLHGQVLANGVPVPKARIEGHYSRDPMRAEILRGGLQRMKRYQTSSQTIADGDGRFLLPMSLDQRVANGFRQLHLRASGPGFAFGPELALPLASGVPLADVVLHVAKPGSMEGRLLTNRELDSRGMSISISRGDDSILTKPLHSAGTYRFDDLAPGRWQAVLLTGELTESEARRGAAYGRPEDIPWRFEVLEGKTTRFDLDYEAAIGTRVELSGTFLVDGQPPVGWTWRTDQNGQFYESGSFDANGRYTLKSAQPGPIRITFGSPVSGNSGYASLSTERPLEAGANEWSYSIETGSVTLVGLAEALDSLDAMSRRAERSGWAVEWEDKRDNVTWRAGLLCGPPEGLTIPQTPTGKLRVTRYEWREAVPGSTQVIQLAAGEHRTVHLGE